MTNKRSSKKIPAHYGMADYYKFFCKEYPHIKISKSKFNNIISDYNSYLGDSIINDLEIQLPFRLGKLEMIKQKREVFLDDNGKVINTNPPDWKATNHLWKNNKEAKEKKILIRHTNKHTGGYVFSIYYNKSKAVYKNKKIYFFKPIRKISRSINKRINDYSKVKYDTYIKK